MEVLVVHYVLKILPVVPRVTALPVFAAMWIVELQAIEHMLIARVRGRVDRAVFAKLFQDNCWIERTRDHRTP